MSRKLRAKNSCVLPLFTQQARWCHQFDFEQICYFSVFNPVMHNVWPFYNIMHERLNINFERVFCLLQNLDSSCTAFSVHSYSGSPTTWPKATTNYAKIIVWGVFFVTGNRVSLECTLRRWKWHTFLMLWFSLVLPQQNHEFLLKLHVHKAFSTWYPQKRHTCLNKPGLVEYV